MPFSLKHSIRLYNIEGINTVMSLSAPLPLLQILDVILVAILFNTCIRK